MPCLLKTEGMTLLQSVLTSDSARMNQNVAVSIRGMCQILAKEFLCKMVVHKFSESIFSSTRQICPVNREHQNHEGDLPFEVHSLSVGVFQPMGHQAQKMKLGAKHNKSQRWQLKTLKGCAGPRSWQAGGGKAWLSCPQEETGQGSRNRNGVLEEEWGAGAR